MLVKPGPVSNYALEEEIQRLRTALQREMDINNSLQDRLGKMAAVSVNSEACVQCRALKLALQDQILENTRLKEIDTEKQTELCIQSPEPVETLSRGVQCDLSVGIEVSQEIFYLSELEKLQEIVARLEDGTELKELRDICKRQSVLLTTLHE